MFPVSDVIPPRTTPFITIGLILVNALVFLYELQLDRQEMYALSHAWGVVPAERTWPQFLTSLFIHDGWIHFGGNILYLWIFADNIEDSLGHIGFLLFYVGAGVLAAVAHVSLHSASVVPLIGASGAVAAVMGAYFVLYPRSQVLTAVFLVLYLDVIEIPAIFFLGIWLLLQLASGLASLGAGAADGGVAIAAHVAGFVSGAAAGGVIRRRTRGWD